MAIQPGWGSQWDTLSSAITGYYGGGIESAQYQQVVQMLNSGEYTMEEMESILANIPEFNRTYNAAGELTGVSYKVSTNTATSSAGSIAQQVNSNVANGTQTQFKTVQTITKDSQTGKVTISDNVVKYKTGQLAPTTMKGVAISALQGILAASAGITIGKKISQAAYDHGFNWLSWAGVDMESLNPAIWSTLTDGDDSLNAKLFNMILGIDDTTKNPQMYMDERALAYMIAYMGIQGIFDGSSEEADIDDTSKLYDPTYYANALPLKIAEVSNVNFSYYYTIQSTVNWDITNNSDPVYCIYGQSADGYYIIRLLSKSDFKVNGLSAELRETKSGTTFYHYGMYVSRDARNFTMNTAVPLNNFGNGISSSINEDLGAILFDGEISERGVAGITDQPGATQFDSSGISDWSDIDAILAALKLQFPELWEERAEVSPDGTTIITYIPVGFPTGGTGQMPTTDGAIQSDLAPDISGDGDNATDELIKTLIDAIQQPKTQSQTGMESDTSTPTKPVDPNGDPRGTGENPPIILPVGSASALWKIYNPSQGQLDTFGAWLWSSDFVDQLLKLFNDPMQAIIGLHKVYCTPPTSGSGPIKVGYLVSDASAKYVSNQYTEIDCGSIDMKEHFNNAFDYDEFTRISIFLPFIGFRDLDVKDVMRSSINVKYGVDVLTGACLAKIAVTRDLNSPILYTFPGNCAVQYPVSSGSYIGIITGLCSLIGGVAGSVASGGSFAPAIVAASAGLPRMHTNVEHSGSISSNSGAMGAKKPYIVIQRPQTHMPLNGILIEGKGQNETVTLGTLSGYVKVKKADLMGIPATGSELDEIRDLLEAGIYMN